MKSLRFIDLFSGIGGFHLAMDELGAYCVFASEIDPKAQAVYHANHVYRANEMFASGNFAGDITKVDPECIPDFDILCGGFPCQPFSVAGEKKGFEDARGTLIYNIAEILKAKRPKAFILENVKGLVGINNGEYLKAIKALLSDAGYKVYHKVLKASDYGLPQRRERIYFVGFRNKNIEFEWPEPVPLTLTMSDVLGGHCDKKIGYTLRVGGRSSGIHDRHNWDRYIVDGKVVNLTPRHALKMMGFPDDFILHNSEHVAMKQLGNSVAVPVVKAIGAKVIEAIT